MCFKHLRSKSFARILGSTLRNKETTSMERELWAIFSSHLTLLARAIREENFVHPTARILRVYLWSVLNDRPVYWACDRHNWRGVKPPRHLPNQSTMSRRLYRESTQQMLRKLLDAIEPVVPHDLFLRMDGKALPVAKHSCDKQATIGRGTGGFQKGYKLHVMVGSSNRPVKYSVQPLNVDERTVAKTFLAENDLGEGYLLADGNYETNPLYDQAAEVGRVLVTPRRFRNAKGLGQSRKHSEHRVAMIERMKAPSSFIREVLKTRRRVETHFANLCNFGGGLTHLPPWVRSRRVAAYVTAKILIRLARDQAMRRRGAA